MSRRIQFWLKISTDKNLIKVRQSSFSGQRCPTFLSLPALPPFPGGTPIQKVSGCGVGGGGGGGATRTPKTEVPGSYFGGVA